MKIEHWIYEIENGPDHDRLLNRLMDRADSLGLHAARSVIGVGLASGTALDFIGVRAEPGLALDPTLERVNANLEKLRSEYVPGHGLGYTLWDLP